ncbi:MAG: DUF2335 domain-containing protein [Fusobacteriaceae bacterium]
MSSNHQKNIPNSQNNSNKKVSIHHQEAYTGPIPHPDLFEKFDKVLPGAAERILKMAELEQENRHKTENIQINLLKINSILGLLFGFIITIAIIGSGLYLLLNDKSIQGFSLIITSIIGLVGAFKYKKKH